MSDKSVTIDELVVADFRTQNMKDSVHQWRVTNHVPFAESCARQIWFGAKSVFDSFPTDDIAHHAVTFHHGPEAYRFLLRLNLGLLSHRRGETNIAGQFYAGWAQLHRDLPEKAKPYDRLIQHLTNDTRVVRSRVMSGWKMHDSELCARDLSDMQHNDSVLIVGHVNTEGKISPLTDNIARKISSNEGRRAREIAFTHPDPAIARQIFMDAQQLSQQKKLVRTITQFDFTDLPTAFELYDRVYITLPMDAYPEADRFMIDSWRGRQADTNVLVHLKANPANMADSSPAWVEARLEQYVSPEQIRLEMAKRAQNNEIIIDMAQEAVDHCVDCRLQGLQPSGKTLQDSGRIPAAILS